MRDDSARRRELTHEAIAMQWLQELSAYYRASRAVPAGAGGRAGERDSRSVVNAGMLSEHRGR
ncbi:MAG: hypothetical protein NFCOHLIN_03203 [Gammaproteobacteria bacterium]|nr:hypothetical protein [Gammaproteobacteria bacterium]